MSRRALLLSTGGLLLLATTSVWFTTRTNTDTRALPRMPEGWQADQQAQHFISNARRRLDFTPFQTALGSLSPAKITELDRRLATATVLDIQTMLAQGELNAEQLVVYYVERIQRYDVNRLNSVLELNPDALSIARRLDAERQAGQSRGPLHGIPVLLKDNIATGDKMHTTAGAVALHASGADRDAFIAQRLRAAGAVILGKTNLSEWANFMTYPSVNGFSALGGPTRNPYGHFDVGGSSSGSGSAIAARLATVGVGTETSGSLTSPATQNSLVTLKPSLGLISRDRIIPISDKMDTAGPMTRTVTDLAVLLNALAGVDANDPLTQDAQSLAGVDFTHFLDANGLRGARVGVVRASLRKDDDPAIIARIQQVMEQAGATVVDVEWVGEAQFDYRDILKYGLREGVNAYLAAVGDKAQVKTLADVIAFNNADLPHHAPYGQKLLEESQASTVTQADYDRLADQNRSVASATLRDTMKKYNVDFIMSLGNYLANQHAPAGFPAMVIPAGYRASGEPVGVVLVADFLQDARLIAAGYAFEQASQWRKDPDMGAR